jgi:hypothetical protein
VILAHATSDKRHNEADSIHHFVAFSPAADLNSPAADLNPDLPLLIIRKRDHEQDQDQEQGVDQLSGLDRLT